MVSLQDLNETFGIDGMLRFDEPHVGMQRAFISTASCEAEIYLHGAHLTQWKPADADKILFLSERSAYTREKAIRGGVPVIFPWFGARTVEVTGRTTQGPAHGFARTQAWQLMFAALSGDELHMTLALGPSDVSRSFGFDHFRIALEFVFGSTLTMRLTVANEGTQPLVLEQALHSYFSVGDAEQVRIVGLEGTEFLDKTESFKRQRQSEEVLTLHSETDRPYLNTNATVTLEDPAAQRRIVIAKRGSLTTVVWNPWAELAAKLSDMEPDEWSGFVCIETANVAENRITLVPGAMHMMETRISVESIT